MTSQNKIVPDPNAWLVQSIDDNIISLLGGTALDAFYKSLSQFHSTEKNQGPSHLDLVLGALNSVVGASGRTVERIIAAKHRSKLELKFKPLPNQRSLRMVMRPRNGSSE